MNRCLSATIAAALLLSGAPASAVLITETLELEVIGGPFDGTTGTGLISYDDALLTGVGGETLNPFDGITVDITLFGQSFDETDDIDFADFPELEFIDGLLTAIDYIIEEAALDPDNPTDIDEPGVLRISMLEVFPSNGGFFVPVSIITAVPEPSTLLLAALGGLLGIGRATRARRPAVA